MTEAQSKIEAPPNSINLKKIGFFLDGWSDLVENMGNKADEVRDEVLQQLENRKMPDIELSRKTGYADLTASDKRAYLISETQPGATTTIYVNQHGEDLYVSWRTHLKPILNNTVFVVLGLAALVIGIIAANNRFLGGFGLFLATFITVFIIGAGSLALVGSIFRQNPFAFFFVDVNVLDAEDITAMTISVHYSVLRALDKSGIDVSKLRIKEKFTGGRKGEDV